VAEFTTSWSASLWPSVNESVAFVALDVVKAAAREIIAATA
jgi:hypothetical protein